MSKSIAPGPGTYGSKFYVGHEGQTKSMSALLKYDPIIHEQNLKPGPGAYSPDKTPTMKKAEGWRIGKD